MFNRGATTTFQDRIAGLPTSDSTPVRSDPRESTMDAINSEEEETNIRIARLVGVPDDQHLDPEDKGPANGTHHIQHELVNSGL